MKNTNILLLTGLFSGILLSFHTNSTAEIDNINRSEQTSNVYGDLMAIKNINDDLQLEVDKLNEEIAKSGTREATIADIESQINNLKKFTGADELSGEGVVLRFNKNLSQTFFIDLINELFSAGAKGISINGVRVNQDFSGFDRLPAGQILLGNEIITEPFEIKAVGKAQSMISLLSDQESVVFKLKSTNPEIIQTFETAKNLVLEKSKKR